MANVEIYDSSNSQLSSDEYSHDEDDDGLMDVAVIGKQQQQQQQTPAKQSSKSNTTTNSSSTETSPSKSTSNETTPRKLSSNDVMESVKKPPDSTEHTQRQIKQMQRNNNANLYFKRRSIKWLNQRAANKIDYLLRLKQTLPKYLDHARRMNAYRAKKRAFEMSQRNRQPRPYDRTPSRSRTHSRSASASPELICLDDTENEDSPEKPAVVPPPTPRNDSQRALIQLMKTPPPTAAFAVQLEEEQVEAPPAENGSVLDEFLTLKPAVAAEPIIEAAVCNDIKEQPQQQQLDLTVLSSYKVVEAIEPAVAANLELPLEEANLKRRRSITPPPTAEKRAKPLPITEELDDDIVEFIPSDMSKQQQPQQTAAPATPAPAQQPSTPMQSTPLPKAANLNNSLNAETTAAATVLKLGSPYTLNASPAFYGKELPRKPQLPEHVSPISYSLELPPTRVEHMEIDYAKSKLEALPNAIQKSAKDTFAAPYAPEQQLLHSAQQLYQQQQQLEQQYQQKLQAAEQQRQLQAAAQQQQQQQQQQQEQQQAAELQLQQQRAAQQQQQQAVNPPQQQQPATTQQQPPQQMLPPPQQPQTPPRSKSRPAQTQTTSPQPPPAPSQPAGRSNKSRVDLNSTNNSDAAFHERVRELYTELDEIMTDKVRAVKPELKAFAEEKQRIDSDIRTLDNLIVKKEEEHNRLLHLRCIKGELRARVERKERMLIMREILPSILNKNCNTSDLYGMQSMLLQEYNSPMPNRSATTAMEQLINRVENGIDDVKMLRSALGMLEREATGEARYEDMHPLHRSNSVPVLRPTLPPLVSTDRSANYGRQGPVRDVRGLIEDYRREHPEQVPLVGKRNKVQPPPSRYQQLINESRQLTNASMNLTAASSQLSQPPQQANNHFDGETPQKPLYNSSPLGAGGRNPNNSRNQSNVDDVQYGATHSTHYAEQMQELVTIEKAHTNRTINNNNHSNYNNRSIVSSTNGPQELQQQQRGGGERRCQHCERSKACYVCEGCMNQWYCSQECQTKGWDTHWKSCHN
ncbi:uncharacterized protein LOC133843602 isoform X2 [Drosophila sulfurigaster albostrigata]|uniref:uncharacterized protein LOC133843602 isoform X2 n=1 Tax=Drosophila sulfurigaster albostrigata TaxID=89887 RepID=UPI002D21DA07|nr:uncharacterized protein LOC133843602 isoform X2 [Drosophila sulfurigaster albostrigata]